MGDNCGSTKYVDARTKWSIIGDVENETIARDLRETMTHFLKAKSTFGDKMNAFIKF